jgi:hypothetical protein
MNMDNTKVAVGLGTLAGFIAAIAAALVPLIGEMSDSTAPLGVDPSLWIKTSAVLAAVTVFGRMLQAMAVSFGGPPVPDNGSLDGTDGEAPPVEG